jgi:hypothetical protein
MKGGMEMKDTGQQKTNSRGVIDLGEWERADKPGGDPGWIAIPSARDDTGGEE